MTTEHEYRKRALNSIGHQQDCGRTFAQAWKHVRENWPWFSRDMSLCRELREEWDRRYRAKITGNLEA